MSKTFLETIRYEDGDYRHLRYHQNRVDNTVGEGKIKLKELLGRREVTCKAGKIRCRILYNEDEVLKIEYFPYVKKKIKKLKIVECNTIVYDKKYAQREIFEKLKEQQGECDDILIVRNLEVTDTSIANTAFYDGSVWVTPKRPLLRGTVRERLLDEGFLVEKEIGINDLQSFEKMALMNAMIDFDIIAEENIRDRVC